MAKKEKTELKKASAQFELLGEAKVNDFTFKIDEQSQKSDWVYNSMRLGVDCGDCGDIYAEMMGGYGSERDNVVYVHGVKTNDDGKEVDDWKNQYKIDWEDRFDEDVLAEIGDQCFIKVGVEKDSKGKTFVKKFLSEYDAIEYIKEHLEDGSVIRVKGNLEYSEYNESIQTKKPIQSIFVSKVDDREKYTAKFTQTILVDKDSLEKIDKDKNVFPISAYVVDYVNKPFIDGEKVEVKKNVVFSKNFEFRITDEEKSTKLVNKLFKPKKSSQVYEVTVEGIITKGANANVELSLSDLPEDIQELVELGAFSEEEALEKCVGKQSSVESYVITNPQIRRVGEEKTPVIAFDKDKYNVDDLLFYATAIAEATGKEEDDEEIPFDIDDEELDMDALLDDIE